MGEVDRMHSGKYMRAYRSGFSSTVELMMKLSLYGVRVERGGGKGVG
jgi:hypothetical protein